MAKGAKKVNAAAGKAVGTVGGKVTTAVRDKRVSVQAKAAEGRYGTLLQWAMKTKYGRNVVRQIDQKATRAELTFGDMAKDGLAKGLWNGAKRVWGGVVANYQKNRRKFGVVGALGIEAGVIALKFAIPVAVAGGVGALAAAGVIPAGVVGSLGTGGGLLALGITKWAGKKLFGTAAGAIGRAGVTAAAGWVQRVGRKPSVRAERQKRLAGVAKQVAGAIAGGADVPAARPPVTQRPPVKHAETPGVPPAAPPGAFIELAREVRRRLAAEGVADVPPLSVVLRALAGVFDAVQGTGGPTVAA